MITLTLPPRRVILIDYMQNIAFAKRYPKFSTRKVLKERKVSFSRLKGIVEHSDFGKVYYAYICGQNTKKHCCIFYYALVAYFN